MNIVTEFLLKIWDRLLNLHPVIEKVLRPVEKTFTAMKLKYGVMALIAALAVPVKMYIFYDFMRVKSNFVIVWLLSCVFIFLLFSAFKNKWIPAGIYFVCSILMFADVAYSSFFNRYLSINMLGAAGFLTDVSDSVKEVLRPKFFLLFVDSLLIFATLVVKHTRWKTLIGRFEEKMGRPFPKDLKMKWLKASDRITLDELKAGPSLKARLIKGGLALLMVAVIILNAFSSQLMTSLANQEFFSYHIKDVSAKVTGRTAVLSNKDLLDGTGTYDEEKDGPLFGAAEGRNLIVIQVESLQNFVINREYNGYEMTPFLNDLITQKDTIYFENYYQQVGSGNTSDAEFGTNNSIFGTADSYTYGLYYDNQFRGLPWLLREKGYEARSYHAYDKHFWNRDAAHPGQGFDQFVSTDYYHYEEENMSPMGLMDEEFFRQSLVNMKEMEEPFYSFLITLTNHYPYYIAEEYAPIPILDEDYESIFGNYINTVNYTDYALERFFEMLKEEGLYENSIIALYGDHLGLTMADDEIKGSMENYLGEEYDFHDVMNVPLIIHIPDAKADNGADIGQIVSVSGGQLDFLPTIAYLMGFEELDTIYMGHNLLTIATNLVEEQYHMPRGSFIRNNVVFVMSKDGVFENSRAYNKLTKKPVPLSECYEDFLLSHDLIVASELILINDRLREAYGDITYERKPKEPIPMEGPEETDNELELAPGLIIDDAEQNTAPPPRSNRNPSGNSNNSEGSNTVDGNGSDDGNSDSGGFSQDGEDGTDDGQGTEAPPEDSGTDGGTFPGQDYENPAQGEGTGTGEEMPVKETN